MLSRRWRWWSTNERVSSGLRRAYRIVTRLALMNSRRRRNKLLERLIQNYRCIHMRSRQIVGCRHRSLSRAHTHIEHHFDWAFCAMRAHTKTAFFFIDTNFNQFETFTERNLVALQNVINAICLFYIQPDSIVNWSIETASFALNLKIHFDVAQTENIIHNDHLFSRIYEIYLAIEIIYALSLPPPSSSSQRIAPASSTVVVVVFDSMDENVNELATAALTTSSMFMRVCICLVYDLYDVRVIYDDWPLIMRFLNFR